MTTNETNAALPRGWYVVVAEPSRGRLVLRPVGASSTPVFEGKVTPEGTFAYLPSLAELDGDLEVCLRTGRVSQEPPAWLPEKTEWPMKLSTVFPMDYEPLSATRTPQGDARPSERKGEGKA